MSTQYLQPNQLEDAAQSIKVPETTYIGREMVGEIPSSNQPEELNLAMSYGSSWTTLNSNVAPSAYLPEQINPFPVTDASPLMASSFVISNEVPSSYQTEGIIQAMSINDTSWMAHSIINTNEASPVIQPVAIYPTTTVAQTSWIQIVVPSLIQPMAQIIPIADGSYATQAMVNRNQTEDQSAVLYQGLSQSEQRNSTEREEDWEVHIQVSLDNLTEPQASDAPMEYASYSPGPLAIDESVRPENQQDNSTIAVPLITDPNVTPELVTFRPGVYEGDAIPPVYSNFSIIAASSDYEPHLPSPIYPNLSIIPEPVPEYQIITEPVTPDSENIIDEEEWAKSMPSAQLNALENVEERPLAVEDTAELQPPTAISGPSTNSGYRGVDAKLLATLRDKNLILIYKDYHFRRHYCKGLKIKWQCVNKWCEAFLYSVGNKITVTYPVHNHLTITSQNVISAQTPETNAISLEEAISAMDDPVSSFNDGTDPNTLRAADTDTITLSYDHNGSPLNSQETYAPTEILATDGNPIDSNVTHLLLTSGNTIISHDPSLEITVKSPTAPTENANDDVDTSIITTLTSGPDPLGICVTSYTPPPSQDVPQSEPDLTINRCSGPPMRPNYNYMTVPKDVKTKVTITSDTIIFKPRVYYDGKHVPEGTPSSDQNFIQNTQRNSGSTPGFINGNVPTVALAVTNASTVSNVPYITIVPTFTSQHVTANNEISFARPAPVIMRTTAASNALSTINSTITPGLVSRPNILELRRDLDAPTASTITPGLVSRSNILELRRDLDAPTASTITPGLVSRPNILELRRDLDAPTPSTNAPRTVVTDASTNTTFSPRNINDRPTICIPRSQMLSGSDPRYTQLYNTFIPRALTQASNQQVSLNEQNVTQGNISSANLPPATSRTSVPRIFRQSLYNPNLSDNPVISTGLHLCDSHRIPIIPIPRVSTPRDSTPRVSTPRFSAPRLSRTMIPTGYSHRRSIRLARARNAQSSPQNTNE